MSQENVELTYQAWAAFNRRDVDAYLALMDEDVEAVPRMAAIEGGQHYVGHEGVRRWWKDLLDVFPDFAIDGGEVRDLGDFAVGSMRLHGHGAGSTAPTDQAVWIVLRWRRGKCVWWRNFDARAEALEAVGLSAQDAHADS